jgi:hypothetical protein
MASRYDIHGSHSRACQSPGLAEDAAALHACVIRFLSVQLAMGLVDGWVAQLHLLTCVPPDLYSVGNAAHNCSMMFHCNASLHMVRRAQ